MKNPLVLTIDFGTQSVRVALVNKLGEIVAIERAKYDPPYNSPKTGYAEQNPDFYFEHLCTCTKALVKNNKKEMENVIGVSMCFFRDSVVAVDKEGKPVRPVILWLDERRAEGKEKLPLLEKDNKSEKYLYENGFDIIDEGVLWLVCLFYGVCDMICILFFCPFQSWFLKNKCCCTCRIYNWDYAMMFTPLFFIYLWTNARHFKILEGKICP